MSNKLKLLFHPMFLFFCLSSFAQEQGITIKGSVKTDSIPAAYINIINLNTDKGTSSDQNGKFSIKVSLHDKLIFTSLIFIDRTITISEKHLSTKDIEVYLEPDVEMLEEVQLGESPFKNVEVQQNSRLDIDRVDRNAPPDATKMTDPNSSLTGIDIRLIYQLLFKKVISKRKKLKKEKKLISQRKKEFPTLVKNLYGDDFFVKDLGIRKDDIYLFLDYSEDHGLNQYYDEKNDIVIIDFLVKQSIKFKLLYSKPESK